MNITEIEGMLDVNGGTRRPKNRVAIVAAVMGCTDPLGMTIGDIRKATGLSDAVASVTVGQLKKMGRLYSLGERKDMRYFPSKEAMEAAAPAYAEFMAVVWTQRKEHEREMRRACDARHHARVKAKRAANPRPRRKPGRKPGAIPKVAKPKVTAPKNGARQANVVIKTSRAWWGKDAEPVITSNTKITIAPSPVAPCRTNTYTD